MTDEETIKKLEELCEYKGYNYTVITDKDVEALHNAIEALRKMGLIKFNVYALNELLREADNEL